MNTYPRHWAFNLATGEVIGCSTSNALKRRVKRNTAWDIAHGYTNCHKWRFFHGAYEDLPNFGEVDLVCMEMPKGQMEGAV